MVWKCIPGNWKELGDKECSRKETLGSYGLGFFTVVRGVFYLFISSEKNILLPLVLASERQLPKQPQDERGHGWAGSAPEFRAATASPQTFSSQAARLGRCVLTRWCNCALTAAPGCPCGVTEGPAHPTAPGVSHSPLWDGVAPSLAPHISLLEQLLVLVAAGLRILGEHRPWIAPTNALPVNPLGTDLRGGCFKS